MSIFQKKLPTKPKKLTLDEIWEIYGYINPPFQMEKYVIQEIYKFMNNISTINFERILHIFSPKSRVSNGLHAGLLFSKGLLENKFFEFIYLMKELS